jgi:alkylation response protein AidB-like acyl-CoA dehydrogenase
MVIDSHIAHLEKIQPELHRALVETDPSTLESDGGPAVELFVSSGAPRLLVPRLDGGAGATAADAVSIQCAVGHLAPSLAVGTAMHHFTVSTLLEAAKNGSETDRNFLKSVGKDNLLLASGFAEGNTAQGILAPTMSAQKLSNGYALNGTKKPCSLARSMDYLTASVNVEGKDGHEIALALIPSKSAGLTVENFWNAPVLRAAESDAVVLNDLVVTNDQLVRLGRPGDAAVNRVQQAGFLWFELLITAAYVGIASRVIDEVVQENRGTAIEQVKLIASIESSMSSLGLISQELDHSGANPDLLRRVLLCRYAIQSALVPAVASAVELLSGMRYISGDPLIHLFAPAVSCLPYHPAGLRSTAQALIDAQSGELLRIN